MPNFDFTSPEGKKYTVAGPDGSTQEQAFAILQAQIAQGARAASPAPVAAPAPRTWADVPGDAIKNLPSSAGNFLGGIAQAVAHPIDTALNLGDVAYGGLRKVLPKPATDLMDKINGPQGAPVTQKAELAADATGQFFKDRYGSMEGLKTTLATDPVGALSDASAVLTGGAGLAKLGATGLRAAAVRGLPGAATGSAVLSGTGQALTAAGNAANPFSAARMAAVKALPKIGEGAAALIGGLGTHTGAESIKQAFSAGQKGGRTADTFADNMRGNVPMTDVLDAAKANIADMGAQKSAAYRQGMAQVSGDQSVLSFSGIDQAVADAADAVSFKGQAKNARAAAAQQAIASEVEKWKALDPAEYHTPEGLDALKQRIGGIVESLPFEEKTARMVGDKIYHAVKTEIVNQAPVYADTMKAYSDATDQIREVERALSLGKKASVDTAMRKLQSLTRNNVNTNYGNRLDLARQLETQGGRDLIPALSGQALSSWTPRGLGNATAGLSGYAGYAAGGAPLALGTLAVQSPRLMGEAALASGQAAAKIKKLSELPRKALGGRDPAKVGNALYQAGRLPQ